MLSNYPFLLGNDFKLIYLDHKLDLKIGEAQNLTYLNCDNNNIFSHILFINKRIWVKDFAFRISKKTLNLFIFMEYINLTTFELENGH